MKTKHFKERRDEGGSFLFPRRHNVSYVRDLVLGADDSVLREFTELHVVFVRERVPERETKPLNATVL